MALDNKLLILGLDSLPPELTKTLAANGTMPFIQELMKSGSFGPLRSIIPANTGGAWNSAWTGMGPETHGFFGFYHYDLHDDTIRISTADRLKTKTLWEMLNQNDSKTLVINSPMQFPATPVDGFMVSGFMTPAMDLFATWPKEFSAELSKEIPDYIFDVRWQKNKSDDETFEKNIQSVITAFEQRVQATKLAAAKGHWDALIIVFKSIDNMLHYTWDYLDENCGNPKRHDLTLSAFRSLDQCCKELAELAGYPKTNIIVCSDHGHGHINGHLYINRLLAENGWLRPQKKSGRFFSKLITSCRKRLGIDKKKKKPSAYIGRRFTVDWEQTKALMISSGVIYLNVKGRQPNGCVDPQDYQALRDQIAETLRNLKDDQGNPMIMEIQCPKEATTNKVEPGQFAVPDILFEPVDGIVLRSSTNKGTVWFAGHPDSLQGCHRIDGIILGSGPNMHSEKSIQANLWDIAPTALAACNLPIPNGLKGRPIDELLKNATITYIDDNDDSKNSTSSTKPVYNKNEENMITQRLADLGYLE